MGQSASGHPPCSWSWLSDVSRSTMLGSVSDSESHFLTMSYSSEIFETKFENKRHSTLKFWFFKFKKWFFYFFGLFVAGKGIFLFGDLRQLLQQWRQTTFDVVDLHVIEQFDARTQHRHSSLKVHVHLACENGLQILPIILLLEAYN